MRWRTRVRHHEVQGRARREVFLDYHLRVGQLTTDTRLPAGCALLEQRLDETEIGAGTTAMLIDARQSSAWVEKTTPADVAKWLGLDPHAAGLVSWDVSTPC